MNHASMIQGMRHSGAKRVIFKHNDLEDLEDKLKAHPKRTPKVIAFESVYSMCGSIGPIKEICDLAKQYGALTFLDEVGSFLVCAYICSTKFLGACCRTLWPSWRRSGRTFRL
jgi:7-keto-8-aminopelargonate synthetase-like enzyme